MARTRTKYRKDDVDEFDRKLRRFNESLAQRERRMLRALIEASLEEGDDTSGYAMMTDEQLFAALARWLTATEAEPVS